MNLLLALLLCGQKGLEPANEADRIAQLVLKNFLAIDNIHIQGTYKVHYSPKAISVYEYECFRSGAKAKYTQKSGNDQISSEVYTNEDGLFGLNNDYTTGMFKIGHGQLGPAVENLGLKTFNTEGPMVAITGNFAITAVNMPRNPCYTFEELLTIGKIILSEEVLGDQNVWLLQSDSPWGVVKLWVEKELNRPLKVETVLKSTGLLATGVTLSRAEKDRNYKTIEEKETFVYHYPKEPRYLNLPQKVTRQNSGRGFTKKDGELSGTLNMEYHYDVVEPFQKAMSKNFVISHKAPNGTPFPISNQEQIAYHLEDGQLVRSANYKLLNQISKSIFGSIGFWQRLAITGVPCLVTAVAGFWIWRRWRPLPT